MFCYNCAKELEEAARYCSACGTPRATGQRPAAEYHDRPPFSRVREGKRVAGVCGGVARYFDIDVTFVRILWLLITIFPPLPGIVAYIVCWIAMPQDPPPVSSSHPVARASQFAG
jgi:phage shock protein C